MFILTIFYQLFQVEKPQKIIINGLTNTFFIIKNIKQKVTIFRYGKSNQNVTKLIQKNLFTFHCFLFITAQSMIATIWFM